MTTGKSAKPKDKSVFDIKVAAAHANDWLTLAVSADNTLSDLHLGILGALEYKGPFREIEDVYQFTIGASTYANGRGSRTALRKLLSAGDIISYSCEPLNIQLTLIVESLYEIATRRHHPKVITDSRGADEYELRKGTELAQYAMRREYRFDEPPIPKPREGATEALSPAKEHGFLTAVAIGPMMMPSAWLGRFTSNMPDLEFARTWLERLMNRYNDTLRLISEGPEAFRDEVLALCARDDDGIALCEWARGFVEAMSIRGDDWIAYAKDVEFKKIIEPIMGAIEISSSDEKRLWLKDATLRRDLAEAIGLCAPLVADFLRRRERSESTFGTTVRRTSPKHSPNEPCVCGSGKKQKRCCGVS